MSEKHETPQRLALALSKNGKQVWYDVVGSHVATHAQDAPQLLALAAEITQNTVLHDDFILFHTDVGRIVGVSDLVDIEPGDKLLWAKRLNRDEYTVFNMSKQPQPSSFVTTAYELRPDGSYELVSAWIGSSDSPSMPGTERETSESHEYWSTHALAWGSQQIQPGTELTVAPW